MKTLYRICCALTIVVCSTLRLAAQGDQTVGNGQPTAPINFPGSGCTYYWVNGIPAIGLAAKGVDNIPSFIAVNNGTTPVVATITATPQPTGEAFIANTADGTISVINTATGKVITTIGVPGHPIGVGISFDQVRCFVTKSTSNSMQFINAVTNALVLKPVDSVMVGQQPWGIDEDLEEQHLYVANAGSNTVSVISTITFTVQTTIPVGTSPKGLVISPDNNTLYVTNSGSNSISVISLATNKVINTIALPESPLGITITADGKTLYVVENAPLGEVVAISTLTGAVTATIGVGNQPTEVAVTKDGSLVYVTNSGSNTVSVINTAHNSVIGNIPVGTYPFGINITPDGSQVYVTNQKSNNVSVISTVVNTVVNVINVGNGPTSFGNFMVGGGSGCSSFPVTVKITVNPGAPPAVIRTGGVTGNIVSCAGNASQDPDIQKFSVLGTNLAGNITATAPAGFEVSLSAASGYAASVSIPESATDSTTVFVRTSATAPVGALTGKVTLSTANGLNVSVSVNGFINAVPTINKVNNQVVTAGKQTTAIHFSGTGNSFIWTNDTPAIGLPASGAGDIAPFTAINNGTAPITATITASPANSNFAYVPNFGDGTISFINRSDNAVGATIKIGGKPYAVAVSPNGNMLYVSDEFANIVSVINTSTAAVMATIPVGPDPSCLIVSHDGKTLYVVNSYSNDVMLFNTGNNALLYDIKVGNSPQGMVLSPDGTQLYVTNSGSKTVSVINTAYGLVAYNIPVNATPSRVAISPDGNTLYVSDLSGNSILIINLETGQVLATIPVERTPQGLVINNSGTLLYVVNSGSNTVSVINTTTQAVTATIPVGLSPFGIAITPQGDYLYVTNVGANTVSVVSTATNQMVTTIPVGNEPDSFGNFIGDNNSGCTGPPVTFTITVNPEPSKPLITTSGTPEGLNTVYGTPSTSTIITLSGADMSAGIVVTPPTGFEVSTDGKTFKNSVKAGSSGTISTTIYIRLAATTPVGNYSGKISFTSAGAVEVDVMMPVSTVTPAPLTIIADNKSKIIGMVNPVLTASYVGFENNDMPAQLTAQPLLTTTAVTTSPLGQYPITADGAESLNYTITYVDGVLTVLPVPPSIAIPNTFTPNGDGINDRWEIKNLNSYPNCSVEVYNRYGEMVYSSIGYSIPWDGTYKGSALPAGVYYYIINLKSDLKVLSGFVVIIR